MKRKTLDKRTIAAIRRRRFMMLSDNGGTPTPPEQSWNMRVVAHPTEGYEMPQTTGNFTLVKQDGDTYYYQHDGSSSTGNDVLYEDSMVNHWNITDVTFKDCEHITSVGDRFLERCRYITTLDLSPLSNATRINGSFLSGCRSLTQIDLSPLSNATRIGSAFLSSCSGLTSLDLSPLSNVTMIERFFLYWCDGLTSIKVPWTTIPTTDTAEFMYGVPSTCSIEVPCEALSAYKSTTPWSKRADYINGGEGCEEPEPQWNMKVVAHPDSGYSMPTSTGNFSLVKQDGDTYFYQHDGSSSTGENVLYDADNGAYWGVESVAFKNCEHITSIDNRFFNECSTLVSIDLSALSNITTIDGNFLRKCSSLPSVDLSALSNVTTIQQSFLNGCSSMTTIDLSPLINCTYSNSYFLYNCTNLATLIAPWVTDIPRISNVGFMSSVPTSCSIIVPCGLVDTYKATSPWSMKKSQLVGDC